MGASHIITEEVHHTCTVLGVRTEPVPSAHSAHVGTDSMDWRGHAS